MKRPSIKRLMEQTGLSRATIDRALNDRPGVHPRSLQAVRAAVAELEGAAAVEASRLRYRFKMIAQAGDAFTDSLIETAAALAPEFAECGAALEIVSCVGASDEVVAERVARLAPEAEGIAIICKNVAGTNAALRECIAAGKAVVSLITDVGADARHAYIGVNNRAAGQAAGFLIGRHLQAHASPNVAVVVATFSYTCHEDREIGFRSLLRHHFPHVNLVEVINGNDTGPATYEGIRAAIARYGGLDGVYNVAGGNEGMAQALSEAGLVGRAVSITHEINKVTEPLLRSGAIDYLLTQDLSELLRQVVKNLMAALQGGDVPNQVLLPMATHSRFSLY